LRKTRWLRKLVIRDISSGGPFAYGHEIRFSFALVDGQTVSLTCRADLLPKIIETLRQFGELAARVRASQPGTTVELVTPIVVTKVSRVGHSDDGKVIALDLATDRWFPIQLAMPPDQARRTIELLEAELDKLPKTKSKRKGH